VLLSLPCSAVVVKGWKLRGQESSLRELCRLSKPETTRDRDMLPDHDQPIAAFCHIPKTGGMTFHDMLRRFLGANHLITLPANGWVYQGQDLRRDLKLNPNLRSIGGHAVRPFVDFGDLDPRIVWYTILREPIERTISNYQHQYEKQGSRFDFHTWLQRKCNQNWHVAMLAGEQDLEAAKQILSERVWCFGSIERYHEFLLLFRRRMGWRGFNVTYRKRRNPPRTDSIRRRVKANMSEYIDDLLRANELDIKLYEYAMTELYSKEVQQYGEDQLRRDLKREFSETFESKREKIRRWRALLFEKGLYVPLMSLLRKAKN
jgi:hypothetical protein